MNSLVLKNTNDYLQIPRIKFLVGVVQQSNDWELANMIEENCNFLAKEFGCNDVFELLNYWKESNNERAARILKWYVHSLDLRERYKKENGITDK